VADDDPKAPAIELTVRSCVRVRSNTQDAHPDLAGAIVGVPEAVARGRMVFEEALR